MGSRQPKQKTLSALSRELPNAQELSQISHLLETESDRGAALVAGALVENILETAIACRFIDMGPKHHKKVFEGSDAPLSTFSSKIRLGLSIGVYGPKAEKQLSKIKDIRNAFAHALRPLDFKNPTIVSHCQALTNTPLPKTEEGLAAARIRYTAICMVLFNKLLEDAMEYGGREITVSFDFD